MPGFPFDVRVEIAFDGPALTATPAWVDITSTVKDISTERGRSSETEQPQPGTLTLTLDDTDGRYDPLNSAGPYFGSIRPNRPVRVWVRHTPASPVVHLFSGYVDTWVRTWPGGGASSVTTVTATDLFKLLARRTVSTIAPAEDAGARIRRLLQASGVAFVDEINLPGYAARPLVAKAYEAENLLQAAQEAAQSDGGPVFVSGAGAVVFQTDAYRTSSPRATAPQGTFGNADGAIAVESDLSPTIDDYSMANVVTITDADGLTQSFSIGASVDRDGRLELDLGSTLLPQAAAETRANEVLIRRLRADPRVESLTVDALTGDDQLAQALNRELSDRIVLAVTPQGGGAAWTLPLYVEAIAHSIAVGTRAQWVTTFQLSPA